VMPKPFYERLASHFTDLGKVLRGQADAAAIFPNSTDVGTARENLYVEFLRAYAPSNCNVDLGWFVFDLEGGESKQIDVIVTASNVPRFRPGGAKDAKVFSCLAGTVGVVCVKSHLDKPKLIEALENIESVPVSDRMAFPVGIQVDPSMVPETPLRVIYATSAVATPTLRGHLLDWFKDVHAPRPGAMFQMLPHIIHVAGQCVLRKAPLTRNPDGTAAGVHYQLDDSENADAKALGSVLQQLHKHAIVAHLALPDFNTVFENMFKTF
jgi:hypothetical protein